MDLSVQASLARPATPMHPLEAAPAHRVLRREQDKYGLAEQPDNACQDLVNSGAPNTGDHQAKWDENSAMSLLKC